MTGGLAPAIGQELIERIEAHSVLAWPAEVIVPEPDGWIMRATPGLRGRGRSNHALAPAWTLSRAEIDSGLERTATFAESHGIECGIQVGPLEVHIPLLDEVSARGWEIQQSVLVMLAATEAIAGFEAVAADAESGFALEITDHATPEWVSAWQRCEPERGNAPEHVDTVFRLMVGGARFGRYGDQAVGIAVESDGIAGLFCLAVNPQFRRQGIGTKLVRGLLTGLAAPLTYLQVFSGNEAGVGLYNTLGFTEAYRYCHCLAPVA